MPTCYRCGVTQATAEMRRSPKKTKAGEQLWLCKEALRCLSRRKEARVHARAAKRANQRRSL